MSNPPPKTANEVSKLRRIYHSMKQRCINPKAAKYANYGGRGIKVCERWLASYDNFYADMGYPPGSDYSIERRDNNGNYEPDNCRWATTKDQARNKRNTIYATHNGMTLPLSEWAEKLSIKYPTLRQRYVAGRRGADLLKPLWQ